MLLKNDIDNLKKAVNNEILTDSAELYCYAEDSANTNRNLEKPDVVIFPESIEDVQKILKYGIILIWWLYEEII